MCGIQSTFPFRYDPKNSVSHPVHVKLNPQYLESVKGSGSEGSIAISVMLETLFVRSNGEVLHPIHQGVVEGVGGGDAHLVWWPGTMSLDISP